MISSSVLIFFSRFKWLKVKVKSYCCYTWPHTKPHDTIYYQNYSCWPVNINQSQNIWYQWVSVQSVLSSLTYMKNNILDVGQRHLSVEKKLIKSPGTWQSLVSFWHTTGSVIMDDPVVLQHLLDGGLSLRRFLLLLGNCLHSRFSLRQLPNFYRGHVS